MPLPREGGAGQGESRGEENRFRADGTGSFTRAYIENMREQLLGGSYGNSIPLNDDYDFLGEETMTEASIKENNKETPKEETKYKVFFQKDMVIIQDTKDEDNTWRFHIHNKEYVFTLLKYIFEEFNEIPIKLKMIIIDYAYNIAYSDQDKFIGSHLGSSERQRIHNPDDDELLSEEDIN